MLQEYNKSESKSPEILGSPCCRPLALAESVTELSDSEQHDDEGVKRAVSEASSSRMGFPVALS